MKRKEQRPDNVTRYGIRVFLDDIEAVVEEARNRGFTISFSDDQWEYESLKEVIEKRGNRPRKLNLIFSRDSLEHMASLSPFRLHIDNRVARLKWGVPGKADDEALWHQIAGMVNNWGTWYGKLCEPGLWAIPFAFFVIMELVAFANLVLGWGEYDLPFGVERLHHFVVASTAGFLLSLGVARRLLGLHLSRKHKGGFWKRNRAEIATHTIAFILGSLFLLLLQNFVL